MADCCWRDLLCHAFPLCDDSLTMEQCIVKSTWPGTQPNNYVYNIWACIIHSKCACVVCIIWLWCCWCLHVSSCYSITPASVSRVFVPYIQNEEDLISEILSSLYLLYVVVHLSLPPCPATWGKCQQNHEYSRSFLMSNEEYISHRMNVSNPGGLQLRTHAHQYTYHQFA